MTPAELLAAGELTAALAAADPLATAPADRLLRAELLALTGEFVLAAAELRGLQTEDPGWPKARRHFLRLLRGAHRRKRGAKPFFAADRPDHAKYRRRAGNAVRAGNYPAAVRAADAAAMASPHVFGHVDGREFDGLRDADDRTASVCELVVHGEYVWCPWEHLRRIKFSPAEHPLDRAFRPARVRFADGEEADAYVPLIYPGDPGDDVFRLGFDTDLAGEDGLVIGVGGKLLLIGEEELPLADVRQIDVRGWA